MSIFKQFINRQLSIVGGLRSFNNNLWKERSLNRISVRTPQNITKKYASVLKLSQFSRNTSNDFSKRFKSLLPKISASALPQRDLHESSNSPKKRIGLRKRRSEHHEKLALGGYFNVMAFATAEEYDLEKLLVALKEQNLYEPKRFFNSDDSTENQPDVLYATAKYQVGKEPRGLYFFREGTVIMWNFSDMESSNILGFLKAFEQVRSMCRIIKRLLMYFIIFRIVTMRAL